MKCLFLYNPESGKGKIKKKLDYIRKQLSKKYDCVDVMETQSGKDLEEKAKLGAENYDAVVFSGGDGTFNHVLQGVGESGVPVGYLPSGTVNDVARSLSIPRSVKGALRVILKGRSEKLDCMLVNGMHYCMYVTAAGAFTSATYLTPQTHKKRFGRMAYAVQALKKNMNFEVFPMRAVCGENTLETHGVLALVMNGRSIAGFPVNKSASMQDGVLELAIIKQVKKPSALQKFAKYFSLLALLLFGVRFHKKDFHFISGKEIEIYTDDTVVWDFDGEEGIRGDVKIEVLPNRVNLFVPKNKKL